MLEHTSSMVVPMKKILSFSLLLPFLATANLYAKGGVFSSQEAIDELHSQWMVLIKNNFSTKVHNTFLETKQIEIKIVETLPSTSQSSFYAQYEDGKIYVSQEMLDTVAASISKLGMGYSDAKLIEIVARKTADLIIHEIRHAITAEQLKEVLQVNFTLPLEEDELLSYQDQARAIGEFQDPFFLTDIKTEALDDMQRNLYSTLMEGSCRGYIQYVRTWNPVNSILSGQKKLLNWFENNRNYIFRGLAMVQKRLEEIRSIDPSIRSELKEEEVKLLKVESDYLKNLATLKLSQNIISDDAKFEILRSFYQTKIEERCGKN